MNILFIAEPYMNLHLPIIEELERQGHKVVYVDDQCQVWEWKQRWRGKRDKILQRAKAFLTGRYQQYWRAKIKKHNLMNQKFDLLFVINGCTFHPYLLRQLQKRQPNIRTVLYLWDDSGIFDYFHYAKYYNKIYTYDLKDSLKHGVNLLPFFFTHQMYPDANKPKYLISTIGTNHSNRLSICRKIYSQLKSFLGGNDFVKNIVEDSTIKNLINLRILDTSLPEDEIITHSKMEIQEVIEMIRESHCILDTDRESQVGATFRFIWALAMKKKIITTNEWVKNYDFYDPRQVCIIDRNNPVIPDDFCIESLPKEYSVKNVLDLRIDNWVKTILS